MRTTFQKFIDFTTFPLRAITLFDRDKWGLSSLRTERFDYCASEVIGYCLDVGCGRYNSFIAETLGGNGIGIDIYPYEGLSSENLVDDITQFPFDDETFSSVTFIANLNHVPRSLRDIELAEAYRCLKQGGNIIVTMGNPFAEILVHKVVAFYDSVFGTAFDVDSERSMHAEEEYYLPESEIFFRLNKAGFKELKKKIFWTQWGLNGMFIGWK
ncbi:MAG: methyltransferase domain-containing protein [Chloroflexota bacterium]